MKGSCRTYIKSVHKSSKVINIEYYILSVFDTVATGCPQISNQTEREKMYVWYLAGLFYSILLPCVCACVCGCM